MPEADNAWDQHEVEQMRNVVGMVGSLAADSTRMFGRREELDPVYWTLGAAVGWGGLPAVAATYGIAFPDRNDGGTPYRLDVADVPVDAFWSVTLYDAEGRMPVNDRDAYSYNSVTATPSDDGSVTIHFGGDPDRPNYPPIVPGWNYIFRAYRPAPRSSMDRGPSPNPNQSTDPDTTAGGSERSLRSVARERCDDSPGIDEGGPPRRQRRSLPAGQLSKTGARRRRAGRPSHRRHSDD